jgi:hypothetical protein
MFRFLTNRLLLLLIAGAAMNIAVCWGIAVVQAPRSPAIARSISLDEAQAMWDSSPARTWEALDVPISEMGGDRLRRWRVVMKPLRPAVSVRDSTIKPTDEFGVVIESQYGWPWQALRSTATLRVGPQSLIAVEHGRWIGTQDELLRRHDLRALALGPMWAGFAANTGVFAAVVMGLLWIPVAMRRRRRLREGRCFRCGYDLRGGGGDSKCPECGAA